jgi:hypothetical protein
MGTKCRCPQCEMSIDVVTSPRPMVCPFCQSRLYQTSYNAGNPDFPNRPVSELPADPRIRYRIPPAGAWCSVSPA